MAHVASIIAQQVNGANGHIPNFDHLRLSKGGSLLQRDRAEASEWAAANWRYSQVAETSPYAVAFPANTQDVQAIVQFATLHDIKLAIKGGGHALWPCNGVDDGLIIDMKRMNQVRIAEDKRTIYIGGGAKWGDVYPYTDAAGLSIVGGGCADVGVGGFCLGAGYSWLTGLYGLGCDNVVGAQVVLADGRTVRCDADHEPELFWSIRGGSSNFGVVTELQMNAYPTIGPALTGVMIYKPDDRHSVYQAVEQCLAKRNPKTSLVLMFGKDPQHAHPGIMVAPFFPGTSVEEIQRDEVTAVFWGKIKPMKDMTWLAPNFDSVSHGADSFLLGVVLIEESWLLRPGTLETLWQTYLSASQGLGGAQLMIELQHGAKTASKPSDFTAYHAGGRVEHYYILLICQYDGSEHDEQARRYCADMTAHIRRDHSRVTGRDHNLPGVSNADHEPAEDIYGPHLERLRRNKDRYDPKRVFNRWHRILPASATY